MGFTRSMDITRATTPSDRTARALGQTRRIPAARIALSTASTRLRSLLRTDTATTTTRAVRYLKMEHTRRREDTEDLCRARAANASRYLLGTPPANRR